MVGYDNIHFFLTFLYNFGGSKRQHNNKIHCHVSQRLYYKRPVSETVTCEVAKF